jgi:hypothetical protein
MQITGHKTRSVFDRDDIVNEADLRNAVSRLVTLGDLARDGDTTGTIGDTGPRRPFAWAQDSCDCLGIWSRRWELRSKTEAGGRWSRDESPPSANTLRSAKVVG